MDIFRKFLGTIGAMLVGMNALAVGWGVGATETAVPEILTSQQMVEATIAHDLGKVEATYFDYELLMGNAEGALTPFPYSQSGDNIAPKVRDTPTDDGQMRFISSYQLLGGKPDSNVVFRITAKENVKFSIAFEAKSDWAYGFLRTLVINKNGIKTQIDRSDIAAGTMDNPVVVQKTVTAHLAVGDTLLFYFGNDTEAWEVIYFTADFAANPAEYTAPLPDDPSTDTETLSSGQMVQATIDKDFGTVSADNFDYELLMGDAEGALQPFTHALTAYNIPLVKDSADDNPGRLISSIQMRGGRSDHSSNVVFRITAKKNVKFSISFTAKSDWATGYLKTEQLSGGTRKLIDQTNIAAGTVDNPVSVTKTVEAHLTAGDRLLFYFGDNAKDWQTIYLQATFTADTTGYVAPEPPAAESLFDLDRFTQKFWEGNTVYHDTICFVEQADGSIVSGSLLYTPTKILTVRSGDLQIEYEEGTDYTISGNRLVLTKDSRIPVYPRNKYCQPVTGAADDAWLRIDGTDEQLILSMELMKYQISVSYTHDGSWAGVKPTSQMNRLPNTLEKLKNKKNLKIVFYGDSITAGWDASGQDEIVTNIDTLKPMSVLTSRAPYMPTWAEMVTRKLKNAYGYDNIFKVNKAAGGADSAWGKRNAAALVNPEKPDLVVVAFGMNEVWVSGSAFRSNVESILDSIHADNPQAEFLLVSCMLPNRDSISYVDNKLKEQEDALLALQSKRTDLAIGVAPVHSMFLSLEKMGKKYPDYSSNNVLHPNDFAIRLYAQTVLESLTPSADSSAPDVPATGSSETWFPLVFGMMALLTISATSVPVALYKRNRLHKRCRQ